MGVFDSYLIQKSFDPNRPSSPVGQRVNIVHVSMLYWPKPTQPKVIKSRRPNPGANEPGVPPPIRAGERPHGEHLEMNPGIRVSGI
jgi:hypothetical protein